MEFLTDVIPRTTTYKEFKEKKARAVKAVEPLPNGQTTLDSTRRLPQRPAERSGLRNVADDGTISPDETIDNMEESSTLLPSMNGNLESRSPENNSNPLSDEHEDVEMVSGYAETTQ